MQDTISVLVYFYKTYDGVSETIWCSRMQLNTWINDKSMKFLRQPSAVEPKYTPGSKIYLESRRTQKMISGNPSDKVMQNSWYNFHIHGSITLVLMCPTTTLQAESLNQAHRSVLEWLWESRLLHLCKSSHLWICSQLVCVCRLGRAYEWCLVTDCSVVNVWLLGGEEFVWQAV